MYIGHAVGAIVADTKELAQRGAKLVEVHFDDLEAVITIEVNGDNQITRSSAGTS